MFRSDLADTVFALASGNAAAAIAVMRMSGPAAGQVLSRLIGDLPVPRRVSLRRVRDASDDILDTALVTWMPGPASYTGEDSAELFLHGGPAVIAAVSAALVAAGARPAQPGEFSHRAFLAGRLTLSEAEAVADLIAAETEAQRRQALRQLSGELDAVIEAWTDRLCRIVAFYEAMVDFPEDVPESQAQENDLTILSADMRAQIAAHSHARRVRSGISVAIVGPPNVGKSTLINALANREVAIVAPSAGTTRDILEAPLIVEGVAVTLVDTAGLRETQDPVEAEGVRRARARAATAECVIAVGDPFAPPVETVGDSDLIRVTNKTDLGPAHPRTIGVCAMTKAGLTDLQDAIRQSVRRLTAHTSAPVFTRDRHVQSATVAVHHIQLALQLEAVELKLEELRLALTALGSISGRGLTEDILGQVFSSFCIGK